MPPRLGSKRSNDPGDANRHLRRGGGIPGKQIGGYRSGTAFHGGRGKRRSKRRSRR